MTEIYSWIFGEVQKAKWYAKPTTALLLFVLFPLWVALKWAYPRNGCGD